MNKIEMLTIREYEQIAVKIIKAQCTSTIANYIYKDEDRFGEVVNAIMDADWKWNGAGDIYGYRKQRAQWCIYKIINKMGESKNKHKVHNFSELKYENFKDKKNSNILDVEQKDYVENLIKNLSTLDDTERSFLTQLLITQESTENIAKNLGLNDVDANKIFKSAKRKIKVRLCSS